VAIVTRLAMVLLTLAWTSTVLRAGIITGAAVPANPVRLPEGIAEIERAIERFKDRDFDQCQALLKSAVANHPDLPPAPLLFAKLCLRLDQPAMGRDVLEQVATQHPVLPETYLVFGQLALQDKRLTEAQLQFDKAAALAAAGSWSDSTRQRFLVEAHSGLAAVAEQRKDWSAAAANLSAWLKLEPRSGQARARLAEIWFRQGEREKARAALELAVKDDPMLDPAAVLMARLFTEAGDLKKAAEWMGHAIKAAPGDPRAHLSYASWLFDNGDQEQAKTESESALRLDPSSIDARALRGLIARSMKDYATAERIFQEMHLESPGNFAASDLWAQSLAELPSDAHRRRGLQMAQVNARLYPDSADALTTLGWVAYRLGQIEQAEQHLRSALGTGKGTSETAYYLARVLADRRKDDEVPRLLKMSLDAPGRFAFRAEARAWLDRLQKSGPPDSSGTKPN
jgi:Tfp pilus assembly protein PilF